MNPLLHWLAPQTLRGRLSLVALTTAALLMAVLTVAFHAVMDRHLQHQADDELRNRAPRQPPAPPPSRPSCTG